MINLDVAIKDNKTHKMMTIYFLPLAVKKS